ncbi:MAG: cupin domain-containing protein [Desulfuromonadales bacterium]|jgi:quercetin dioxygenase-like cupin family protein/DNA-binding XRE family transcriptional regulator|nr:cupin domain-containing protein [Desulfuromonadales bacterium]
MPEQNIRIGERVKSLRLDKKMSIEDVAQKSGISAAGVAAIEDQTVAPPLGHIISLANALQVTVGELFEDSADAPFCIVRSDARKTVSRFSSAGGKSGGYSYESLGHQKQNRHMEPFLVTLTPGEASQAEPNQHLGEEIIYVLEGQVEVRLSGHTDVLNPGDSIYYDSNLPHIISCHGKQPATILAVIYAEQEMMIL